MEIEQEKSRIKKWITGYLAFSFIFLIIGLSNPLFLILTAMFLFIASRMFKDIKKLDEEYEPKITNVQEVVTNNLETKQINTEVNKMQISKDEKDEVMEMLSKDEDVMLYLKVTKGQVKYTLFEKMRAELETKPITKAVPAKEVKKEQPAEEEDEDIVVED